MYPTRCDQDQQRSVPPCDTGATSTAVVSPEDAVVVMVPRSLEDGCSLTSDDTRTDSASLCNVPSSAAYQEPSHRRDHGDHPHAAVGIISPYGVRYATYTHAQTRTHETRPHKHRLLLHEPPREAAHTETHAAVDRRPSRPTSAPASQQRRLPRRNTVALATRVMGGGRDAPLRKSNRNKRAARERSRPPSPNSHSFARWRPKTTREARQSHRQRNTASNYPPIFQAWPIIAPSTV